MRSMLIAFSLTLSATMAVAQGAPSKGTEHAAIALPDHLTWGPAPPGLPAGAKVTVLEGNPAEPGPFTIRASMPNHYRVPPHYHDGVEHLTVIKGKLGMGMGDKFDASALSSMPAGAFVAMQPGTHHFVEAQGETILQLHGVGPWTITYLNPTDDPRKKTP